MKSKITFDTELLTASAYDEMSDKAKAMAESYDGVSAAHYIAWMNLSKALRKAADKFKTTAKPNPLLVWERHTGPDIPSHWQGEPGGFFIHKQHFGLEPFTVQVNGKDIGTAPTLAEAKIVAECYSRAPSKKKLKTKLLR